MATSDSDAPGAFREALICSESEPSVSATTPTTSTPLKRTIAQEKLDETLHCVRAKKFVDLSSLS